MCYEHFVNLFLISAALDLAPHPEVEQFNKRRGDKSSNYGMLMFGNTRDHSWEHETTQLGTREITVGNTRQHSWEHEPEARFV